MGMSSIICSLILLSITVQLIMDKEIMSTVTNRTNEPLVLVSEQPTNTHKSISLVVNEISSIDLDLAFQMFGNIILDRDHKTFSNKSNNASYDVVDIGGSTNQFIEHKRPIYCIEFNSKPDKHYEIITGTCVCFSFGFYLLK